MATNILNITPQLNPLSGEILSIKLIGRTDRTNRIRITITSPNIISPIIGQVQIDTNAELDSNNQRIWEREFTMNNDFFNGELSCNDILDINIEWLNDTNVFVQEDNTQIQIDCDQCIIQIERLDGVRLFSNTDQGLLSLKVTLVQTGSLCQPLNISITDDGGNTYSTRAILENGVLVANFVNEEGAFSGKNFKCGNSYRVIAECENDSSCSRIENIIINCSNFCPESLANVILRRNSDNIEISDHDDLDCIEAGSYTISVTYPPANIVSSYEWKKDNVIISREVGRSYTINIGNQECSTYLVIVKDVNGCAYVGLVNFSCKDCKRDCVVSDWSPWGDCINNTRTRSRIIIQSAANGGRPCPPLSSLTDTEPCTTPPDTTPPGTTPPGTTPPSICDFCCIWFYINVSLSFISIVALIVAGCVFQWLEPISTTIAIVSSIITIISWILWGIFCLLLNRNNPSCQPLLLIIQIFDWVEMISGALAILLAFIGQIPCAFAFASVWGLLAIVRRILVHFAQVVGCLPNPFDFQRN